jgi:transcriptional regulator with XRE-family HTH domain
MHRSTAHICQPILVERTLKRLGAYLRVARKRRQMREIDVALLAGISRYTLRRIETGNPGTGIGSYVAVLHALALDAEMADVAHPALDWYDGVALTVARRIRRVRPPEDLLTIEMAEERKRSRRG